MPYGGQHNQSDIRAAHDGKGGCNTVEYGTASLYSDWLYFLWRGIKGNVQLYESCCILASKTNKNAR